MLIEIEERDMFDQRNQQFSTILVATTIVLSGKCNNSRDVNLLKGESVRRNHHLLQLV